MTVLVYVEHDNGHVKDTTLRTITAAKTIGDTVHALVLGADSLDVATQVAQVDGVDQVLYAQAPHFAHELAENVVPQILSLASNYTHFVFSASTSGKNIAPRVATKLNVGQVSEVIKVQSAKVFEHPIYAGNVIETVESLDEQVVLTIRTSAYDKAASTDNEALIETIAATEPSTKVRFVKRTFPQSDRPELTSANVVVTGGRALGSAEQFTAVLDPLVKVLHAALGASRAAVDAGYAPNDWQVGQTGKIVAPELYVAVGVSGAVQHLAGISGSKFIVAINKDPQAPIFKVADYGIVGDLFEIVPQLVDKLSH